MIANYATNIALIDRATNTVTTVIWGMVYQEKEFTTKERIAVVVDDLCVAAGDNYDGEHFYHDGERVLSVSEQMADMQTALNELGVNPNG